MINQVKRHYFVLAKHSLAMVLSSGAYRETRVSHLEFWSKYRMTEMFLMRDPRLSSSTEEYNLRTVNIFPKGES